MGGFFVYVIILVMTAISKKRVLLVEDDQFLRTLYFDLLTAEKYDIDVAIDGEAAYTKMQQPGWDLILLDIILPKIDGIQIIEKMEHEHPEVLKNKIIFLTNLDKNEMIQKVKKLGFSYLIKSDLNPQEFVDKVRALLLT